jgi:peroxiredoxin Q/BCP
MSQPVRFWVATPQFYKASPAGTVAAVLAVGAVAPHFEAMSSDGRTVRLSDFRGKCVVLYFFPKAFTPICTLETRRFRDSHADLAALGAEVVGVSADDIKTQCEFGRRQAVNFPLLADSDRHIAKSYGVLWPLLARARRVTFIIDENAVVELVTWHEFQISKHLDDVFLHLRKRSGGASAER